VTDDQEWTTLTARVRIELMVWVADVAVESDRTISEVVVDALERGLPEPRR